MLVVAHLGFKTLLMRLKAHILYESLKGGAMYVLTSTWCEISAVPTVCIACIVCTRRACSSQPHVPKTHTVPAGTGTERQSGPLERDWGLKSRPTAGTEAGLRLESRPKCRTETSDPKGLRGLGTSHSPKSRDRRTSRAPHPLAVRASLLVAAG